MVNRAAGQMRAAVTASRRGTAMARPARVTGAAGYLSSRLSVEPVRTELVGDLVQSSDHGRRERYPFAQPGRFCARLDFTREKDLGCPLDRGTVFQGGAKTLDFVEETCHVTEGVDIKRHGQVTTLPGVEDPCSFL